MYLTQRGCRVLKVALTSEEMELVAAAVKGTRFAGDDPAKGTYRASM